jgi:hypothetical protein
MMLDLDKTESLRNPCPARLTPPSHGNTVDIYRLDRWLCMIRNTPNVCTGHHQKDNISDCWPQRILRTSRSRVPVSRRELTLLRRG